LRRAAGRVALDDEQLGKRRIALLAVGELAGQRARIESALAASEILRLPCRLADARRLDALAGDLLPFAGMLFEVAAESLVDERLDEALDLAVAELGL